MLCVRISALNQPVQQLVTFGHWIQGFLEFWEPGEGLLCHNQAWVYISRHPGMITLSYQFAIIQKDSNNGFCEIIWSSSPWLAILIWQTKPKGNRQKNTDILRSGWSSDRSSLRFDVPLLRYPTFCISTPHPQCHKSLALCYDIINTLLKRERMTENYVDSVMRQEL